MNAVAQPRPLGKPEAQLQQLLAAAESALGTGQAAEAAKAAQAALGLQPHHAIATLILGIAQDAQGLPESLDTLARAVQLAPDQAQFRYNLGVSLAARGFIELAVVEYDTCLRLQPHHADALWNLGEILRLREHFERALMLFERLASIEGFARSKLAHRMGVCCAHILGQETQAVALFEQEIAADPDAAVTHWEYARFRLGRGEWDSAWRHYAHRFSAGATIHVLGNSWGLPAWDGVFRPGTLVVQGEQGAGEEILFSAYIPGLLRRCLAKGMIVVLACRPTLVRLFESSFPQAVVVAQSANPPPRGLAPEGSSWELPIGDLPLHLPKPQVQPYLRAPADEVQRMAHLLQAGVAQERPLRVGLVCVADQPARSAPGRLLNELARRIEGVQWYSLAPREHRASLADLADMNVHDMGDLVTDMASTAALMTQMDRVLCVCTATANVAGALGCNTSVLLNRHGEWRWQGDASWYARVRTFRQRVLGDWATPLREALVDIARKPRR